MAIQNLTVRSIEALKPTAKRYEVFDALTPGLAIRVTPSGHKSWVLLYRYHGRLRRLTLGMSQRVLESDGVHEQRLIERVDQLGVASIGNGRPITLPRYLVRAHGRRRNPHYSRYPRQLMYLI